MAAGYESVKCKSCARVLAAVSVTGLTPMTSPDTSHAGCSTCQQFDSLYDAIRAADTEWAALENKRDSVSKSFARNKHKRAHMEFDNWLMTVEAPGPPRDSQDGRPENKDPEDGDIINGNEQQVPGTKRRRSHSPTIITQRPGDTSDLAPHEQQGISLSLRPWPKRWHSAASSTGRKRLKFSDSVEFHDDYRSSEQYHRPSETYVRGRNAPPEGSEYMDTSGSGLTFLKFTGMKKVGAKWIELSEEELAKQSENAKTWAGLRKHATAGKSGAKPADGDLVDEVSQNVGAPPDARAARLARRTKGVSSAESVQTRGTTSRRSREASRKDKQSQLISAPDGVQETAFSPPLALPTTTTDGDHHHADRSLSWVENIGDDGLERSSDAVPETATTAAMCADQVRDAAKPHDEPHMGTQVTSEAKCQGNAAQPSTSTVGPQLTVFSGHGLSQNEPMKNASCTGYDASAIGRQEASPKPLVGQPISTNHKDSKTASRESLSRFPAQKGDIVRDDGRLSAPTTPVLLEEAVAIGTRWQEHSAEREDLFKDVNTSISPENKSQVQGHSNAANASVGIIIPQDPDGPCAAKTCTGEMQMRTGGVMDEAEDAVSRNPA